MDAAKHEPVAMIAELARAMNPERRGRFLDAACGGDAKLRAEVERSSPTPAEGMGASRRRRACHRRRPDDLVPGSLESIALEALNEAPPPPGRRRARRSPPAISRSTRTATGIGSTPSPGCGSSSRFAGRSTTTINAA